MVLRLPGKPAADNSYWAFGLQVPFSQCHYQYVTDLSQLSTAYEFVARHPMVGNPCTHSVFDPLQMKEVPGNYLVRGAIVHGWDTRPPYQIEVRVQGNEIRAIYMAPGPNLACARTKDSPKINTKSYAVEKSTVRIFL